MERLEERAERLLNDFNYEQLSQEEREYLYDSLNFSLRRDWGRNNDVVFFVFDKLSNEETILTNILTEFSRDTMNNSNNNNGNNNNGNNNNGNNPDPILGRHPPITPEQRETFLTELIEVLVSLEHFTPRQQMSENIVETPYARTPAGSNNENENENENENGMNGMNGSGSPSYPMRPRKSRKARKSRKSRKSRKARKSRKSRESLRRHLD